jgi:HEAT repeat protein
MKKRRLVFLTAVGVIGLVLSLATFYAYLNGYFTQPTAAELKLNEYHRLKQIVQEWDKLSAGDRTAEILPMTQGLDCPADSLRTEMVRILTKIGKPAVPGLIAALHSDSADARAAAATALGNIGADAGPAFDGLVTNLEDKAATVRARSAVAVGQLKMRSADAVPALAKHLTDPVAEVRSASAAALVRFGKEAVPALRDGLKNQNLDIVRVSASALGQVGADAADAVPDLVASLVDEHGLPTESADALVAVGGSAVAPLTNELENKDPAVRIRVTQTLARIGKPAVAVLAKASKAPEPNVRFAALTGLAASGSDGLPALLEAIGDEDAVLRQEAARLLAAAPAPADPKVAPALVPLLKDPSELVRTQAVSSLKTIHPDPAIVVPLLKPLLADTSNPFRFDALRCVANLGDAGVPIIAEGMRDSDAKYRKASAFLLAEMRAEVKVLYPALLPLLKDENLTVRQDAIAILQRCGAPAIPHLLEALKDENALLRQQAIWALYQLPSESKEIREAFFNALRDPDPIVRSGAVIAMSRYGNPALPALEEALKDKETVVREKAATALQFIRSDRKPALALVLQAQHDEKSAVRAAATSALVSYGQPAVAPLLEALKDPDEVVWKKATEALAKVPVSKETMMPLLAAAARDENVAVRQGAVFALERFEGDAEPLLIGALHDPDAQVCFAAARALGNLGPPARRAIPDLAKLATTHSNVKLRSAVLGVMLRLQGLERYRDMPVTAVPVLVDRLKADDATIRAYAALTLGAIGPDARESVAALTEATKDPEAQVREAAKGSLPRVQPTP